MDRLPLAHRDSSEDYALLVGVSDYPNAGYAKLHGPPNDVVEMKQWLTHPDGGNIPEDHVEILQSPVPMPGGNPFDYPPRDREAWHALKRMVLRGDVVNERPQGRLYLYFSGHGFSNFMESHQAALYMGNADRVQPSHVCGTSMARWCANAAAFGEIVLIMDCCRDQEIAKNIEPAPLVEFRSPASKNVKVMEIYAVPYDGKAQEREFKRSGGKVLGILTYALHRALWSAQANGNGMRDGHAIKTFIEGAWGTIVGQQRVEAPEVVLPKRGDIVFSSSPPQAIKQTIRFSVPLGAPSTLCIVGTDGRTVDTATLDPQAQTCTWDSTGNRALPFDGSTVAVLQAPMVYEAVLKRVGTEDRSVPLNMLGEDDVHFEI